MLPQLFEITNVIHFDTRFRVVMKHFPYRSTFPFVQVSISRSFLSRIPQKSSPSPPPALAPDANPNQLLPVPSKLKTWSSAAVHKIPLLRKKRISNLGNSQAAPLIRKLSSQFPGKAAYDYASHSLIILLQLLRVFTLPAGLIFYILITLYNPLLWSELPKMAFWGYLSFWCLLSRLATRGPWGNMRASYQYKKISLRGRHLLITGGTGCIGREIARFFAKAGADVTIVSRPSPHAQGIVEKIRNVATSSQKIQFVPLDLRDFRAIKNYAKALSLENRPIDFLVHCAGVVFRNPTLTPLGNDGMIAVNAIAPFLLTESLLPLINASTVGGRIVYLASQLHQPIEENIPMHYLAGRGGTSWSMKEEKRYTYQFHYAISKLVISYHAQDLAIRAEEASISYSVKKTGKKPGIRKEILKNPNTYSVAIADPGVVLSNLFHKKTKNLIVRCLRYLWLLIMRTPFEGAQTPIDCCLRKELVSGGIYYDCRYSPEKISESLSSSSKRKHVIRWLGRQMDINKES